MNKLPPLPPLPITTKKEPSAADLLQKGLLDDFSTESTRKAAKDFFGVLNALKTRGDIPLSAGRRWSEKKARDYNCYDLIVSIAKTFNVAFNSMGEKDKQLLVDLLEADFVLIGKKGKDRFRRTLYCLYTPKGSIPLDQPLGEKRALLHRKNKRKA